MTMKKLLDGDAQPHAVSKTVVSNANDHPSGDTGDVCKNTVSHPKHTGNIPVAHNTVSHVNSKENPAPQMSYDSGAGKSSVEPGSKY